MYYAAAHSLKLQHCTVRKMAKHKNRWILHVVDISIAARIGQKMLE